MSTKGSHSRWAGRLWVVESVPQGSPLVLLIHGSLDRSAGMARVGKVVHELPVIRYDRRGYGRSRLHPGPFTVRGNSDDVAEILDGREAVVVGHSFGGNIALAAAQKLGGQILGVSTYETPLSWMDWWPSNTAGAVAAASDPESAAENFMVRLIGRERWDSLPASTREERRGEGPALVEELTDLRLNAPWEPGLIRCRVIAGHGSRGTQHHRQGAEWISRSISGASLATIDGAGHAAPVSHAKEFVEALIRPHLEGRSTFKVTS